MHIVYFIVCQGKNEVKDFKPLATAAGLPDLLRLTPNMLYIEVNTNAGDAGSCTPIHRGLLDLLCLFPRELA